ncbi:MAG: leucyl aminopeptidase [Ardenticatenia bacterium]|nr:leucyl aminopeptidase [Ardenticatenia bacterium]
MPSPVQLTVLTADLAAVEADAIVVNLFQGVTSPGGATGAVDHALGGRISQAIAAGGLKGRLGETLVLFSASGVKAPRVVVVGLGKREGFGEEAVRRASAAAAKAARQAGARTVATIAHGAGIGGLDPETAARATVEGALLGLYRFTDYKSKTAGRSDSPDDEAPAAEGSRGREVTELRLVGDDQTQRPALDAGARRGEAVAVGVNLARDLSNHPANVATPSYLADAAGQIARRHGQRCEVWDRAQIIREGMGALASVAAGGPEEPRYIILEHAPAGTETQSPVVLAGKAVTFDTGGISLKPGLRMGMMKMDMSGGAAVLGAMETIGRLGLGRRVIGLVGATENMPSGTATRPGDIVTALNGTTIEILNTDAEGRMVLADVLSHAQRFQPAAVVDLATLTGAIGVALGPGAAGLFSNDDALSAALSAAGDRSGERLWRLPLWDEPYAKMIESEVADIKNTADSSPSPAGAIFGAKFLERFVTYPWVHLDIAAMAWGADRLAYNPKGATGFGVRLLVDWLHAGA